MNTIYKKFLDDKKLWVILSAALIRMGFYGFRYFPLLDDYIQYGTYPTVSDPFQNIYIKIGLYATRPLASIFDIFIWGGFWHSMGFVLFVMTIMHGLSAYFFIKTAEKLDLPLGLCFAVVFVLCPINFEGSYWVSASSRIVLPVFLVSLSCFALVNKKLVLFSILQFLSMMFYEQAIVLSIILSFFIILKIKKYNAFYALAFNFSFIFIYYLMFSKTGSFGSRASLKIINIDAVFDIFKSWDISWIYRAFLRGIEIGGIWFIVAAILVSLCFASDKPKFDAGIFIVGLLIFVLTYAPLIILKNYNIALRNCFIPLIGMAMMVDTVLGKIKFKNIATCILAIFFIIIAPSELYDYKQNYEIDQKIIEYVALETILEKDNAIKGQAAKYVKSNFDFGEHITSVASSDWALTGAVRERNPKLGKVKYYFETDKLQNFNLISLEGF